jgi:hypothetical protein
MGKFKVLGDADYIVAGRRFPSDGVAVEADLAIARWVEDMDVLSEFGLGAASLAYFRGLVADHRGLRASRAEAVAAKSVAIGGRDDSLERGWEWTEEVVIALQLPAMKSGDIAAKLNAAHPERDTELATGIRALGSVLEAHRAEVDASFDVDGRLARGPVLAAAIEAELTGAERAKTAPKQDTRALDLLDGRIVATLNVLNRAGRKAFNRLGDRTKADTYRHHVLNRRPTRNVPPTAPTA